MEEFFQLDHYSYALPQERIAQNPLDQRDGSKLLLYKEGKISHRVFEGIVEELGAGDILLMNTTKVVPARLHFYKPTGAKIELFVLGPADEEENPAIFYANKQSVLASCLIRNSKKWKEGSLTLKKGDHELIARRISPDQNKILFVWQDEQLSFGEVLELFGSTPLPPYIKRDVVEGDHDRYQSLLAQTDGAVAAPTASLHFSESVLNQLKSKGVEILELCLHVGAGTFKPVSADDIRSHHMHAEWISIPTKTIERLNSLASDSRVIPVGTTAMRSIESLSWLRSPDATIVAQNAPYEQKPLQLSAILDYLHQSEKTELSFSSSLMIRPGYEFQMSNGIVTNFHIPQSSLLMLVAAFCGSDWKKIYDYALANSFRFLSYGDSSLLLP